MVAISSGSGISVSRANWTLFGLLDYTLMLDELV